MLLMRCAPSIEHTALVQYDVNKSFVICHYLGCFPTEFVHTGKHEGLILRSFLKLCVYFGSCTVGELVLIGSKHRQETICRWLGLPDVGSALPSASHG